MRIAAVGSALPAHRYPQEVLRDYLAEVWRDAPAVARRLRELHENVAVQARHLAMPLEAYAGLTGFSASNAAFVRCAVDLGERAIADALGRTGLRAGDIDALFVTTVTGVCSPSLDARLCNRMGFRPDVKRLPLFGLGCVAGAAGVSRAADYVRAFPDGVALVLAVELCSLTLQRDDRSVANLIAAGLFGDGAAAAVVLGAEHPAARGPAVTAVRSVFYPDTEDVMGWDIGAHGFRLVLSPAVPAIARERLPADVDRFLGDHGLRRADIAAWVCHPGGPKVLQGLQDGLGLEPRHLAVSWKSLRRCGNLSSASVLLVLQHFLAGPPPAGTWGLMLALGPGFCSEMLLLRW